MEKGIGKCGLCLVFEVRFVKLFKMPDPRFAYIT